MTTTQQPQEPAATGRRELLAAAERDLAGHRAAVTRAAAALRGLRRAERRIRRREQLRAARRAARVTAVYGLVAAGLGFFAGAVALLTEGDAGGLAWFGAGAAAWRTAAALRR
ncbi:hypothetical protein OH807_31870 [Kitasatospora sp. NBC_01560]|uniref:hypothetical protein n=1 Tax=Kitasatospora sp. NBC_01560 TaxID=2975965 RepID=UPI00386D571D